MVVVVVVKAGTGLQNSSYTALCTPALWHQYANTALKYLFVPRHRDHERNAQTYHLMLTCLHPQNANIIWTSSYDTWFTAGGAIRIAHYDVSDDVITRKL